MFVAGVWHGANWNYVIWGIIIGFSLMFERNVLSRSKFWSESKSKPAIVVRFFTISIFWF
jgi:alginate O-acetyltransferase complex protein AlgI